MNPSKPKRPRSRTSAAATSRKQFASEVRIGPLLPILALLREAGIDPVPVLKRCGLRLSLFDDADNRITFDKGKRLLLACAAATGRSDFGLLIGQRFDFAAMGVLGKLMQLSPTLGDALKSLRRYLAVHDTGGVVYLEEQDQGEVALGYAVYEHATPAVAMIYDMAMAIVCKVLRTLCGPRWKASRVQFAHGRPADVGAYRRYFAAPLSFDAPRSAIHFDAQWLASPMQGVDDAALAAARRAAEAVEGAAPLRRAERARAAVLALLMTGALSGARVASALALSERSLRRQLRDEGTSLQAIVGEARFEAARQMLRDTALPIRAIAEALQYADAAAFSRAFKLWSAQAPTHWRQDAMGER